MWRSWNFQVRGVGWFDRGLHGKEVVVVGGGDGEAMAEQTYEEVKAISSKIRWKQEEKDKKKRRSLPLFHAVKK